MNDQQIGNTQTPPPNYLVWGILTTIFCCLPFGIVSIIFAAQVNSKWMAGDHEGALIASRNAKIWAWVAGGIGLAAIAVSFLLAALGVIAGFGLQAFDF